MIKLTHFLLVFALTGTALHATAPLGVSSIVVEGLGRGTIALDGQWQFRVGDDPAWSSPTLDDTGWEAPPEVPDPSEKAHMSDFAIRIPTIRPIVAWPCSNSAILS